MNTYPSLKYLFLLTLLSSTDPAFAKNKKSLNWRMRKKPAASTVSTVTAEGVSVPKLPPGPQRLMAGRWTPEVRAAIDKLIEEKGKSSPSYDLKAPPVAVLPWSNAAVSGDPAELIFLRLVTQARFKVDDTWWEIVPIVYGRQTTRAAYDSFISLSSTVWTSQPGYHGWRKGMLSSYIDLCRGVGRKECRSYLARLWAGWRDEEAQDFAKTVLADEKKRSEPFESIPRELGDASALRVRRGLRVIPEIRDLAKKLRSAGFDVWVIDDIPQPVLLASAVDYGLDPSRTYGIHNSTDGPRMGANVLKPVPTRGGKTEIVQSALGRAADLVVGRDNADFEVLNYGDGLRVIFDSDPELVKRGRERGWLVQQSFAR